ncbi:EH signature domain-containing protein [Beggiatoa leptomitoformis]|uniref:Zorya protein ZorC EH domain-containing protein n=1 Tax=Beggiatoa leptomitoformis TaxID=288004 RepID=A0A2N9YB12_9GAMM|nr:EH signature domain-containing protein [Beggiatoa leptomitoformis]ALG66989.1 hypothetical protein AL038_03720 [Beggiatoa leptomitoformis]AUI67640.1 hypothetical protein BLE401_02300 [Beggiatoa leptomitoformis]
MKLRRALQECQDTFKKLNTHSLRVLDDFRLVATVKALPDFTMEGKTPKANELLLLYEKFQQVILSKQWQDISPRDWRRAAWVLWYGKQGSTLAENELFLKQFWRQVRGNPAAVKRLIRVYLREFDQNPPNLTAIAQFILAQVLKAKPDSMLARWQQYNQLYQLFIPQGNGVNKLAQACLRADTVQTLGAAGLTGELLSSGYARAAYREALEMLETYLLDGSEKELICLLAWSDDGGRLRYASCRRELAQALLLPWQLNEPNPLIRQRIQIFLLQYLQDPRVSPALWQGVQTEALQVFYRWMVGSTLETFFSILDQCALDAQWRYRRAFWWAYYERQYIDEAWLAVGKTIQKFLAKRPELAQSLQNAYGTLEGAGVRGNQAVLLFRIRGVIVAEWSHGGKCHIWLTDSEDKPPFYQETYLRDRVTANSLKLKEKNRQAGISHYSNEAGGWQTDLERFIYEQTRIDMSPAAYMPKI